MQTPEKITFGEMREMGVRDLLIYCADYKCSRSIAVNADQCPDDVGLSDIEGRFVCKTCGKRGADVRPDFHGTSRARSPRGFTGATRRGLICALGKRQKPPTEAALSIFHPRYQRGNHDHCEGHDHPVLGSQAQKRELLY